MLTMMQVRSYGRAGTRVEAGTKVYLQISKGPRVQFIEGEVIGDGAVSDEGGVW